MLSTNKKDFLKDWKLVSLIFFSQLFLLLLLLLSNRMNSREIEIVQRHRPPFTSRRKNRRRVIFFVEFDTIKDVYFFKVVATMLEKQSYNSTRGLL